MFSVIPSLLVLALWGAGLVCYCDSKITTSRLQHSVARKCIKTPRKSKIMAKIYPGNILFALMAFFLLAVGNKLKGSEELLPQERGSPTWVPHVYAPHLAACRGSPPHTGPWHSTPQSEFHSLQTWIYRWISEGKKAPAKCQMLPQFPPAAVVVLAGDRVDAWLQLLPNLGVSNSCVTHHSAGPGTTRLLLLQHAVGLSESPLHPFSMGLAWRESEKGKHQEDVATLSCQQMLFQCPLLENVFGPHSWFM